MANTDENVQQGQDAQQNGANNADTQSQNQQNAPKKNNNSRQQDNSSQKRKGDNSSSKSSGDREHSSAEGESSEDGEEKQKDSYVEKKGKDEAKSEGTKAVMKQAGATLMAGFKGGLKSGMQSLQQVGQILKQLPAAIINTIIAAITGVICAFIGVIAAIVSDVVPTLDPPPEKPIAYTSQAFIGNSSADTFNAAQSQREMARRIWSVMSAFQKCDDPGGGYYASDTDGSNMGAVQVTFGLRPEQICALLGNWEHESALDPTSVETLGGGTHAWNIDRDKQYAITIDFNTDMFSQYDADGFDRDTYFNITNPKIYKAGIGLAQWTDTYDPSAGRNSWDITNPGRNTKLQTYAYLYGQEWYQHVDEHYDMTTMTGGDGWNGEQWIPGSTETQGLWYDPEIQLAFALDKDCDFGDSSAQWLWDWANDPDGSGDSGTPAELFAQSSAGEDFAFLRGDEQIALDNMVKTKLEGWADDGSAWNAATGWDPSHFIIKDEQYDFAGTILTPIGSSTADVVNFRGTGLTLSSPHYGTTADEYYSNGCAAADDYIALVTYENFNRALDGLATDTQLDRTPGYTIGNTSHSFARDFTDSGAHSARDVAFWYAMNCAYACWHGGYITYGGSYTPNLTLIEGYNDWDGVGGTPAAGYLDFLMMNDPRTYTMDNFQHPITCISPTCPGYEHTHGSGCNSSSCTHSHGEGCCSLTHPHTGSHNSSSCSHTHDSSCCSLTVHTHTPGFAKNSGAADSDTTVTASTPYAAANAAAAKQFKNLFKYMYRYHLYRYQTLYYTAQFVAEYEGVPGNGIESRFTNALKWFNMWWAAGDGNGKAEPNVYAKQANTPTGFGNNDQFFLVEEAYAAGILLGMERTQDSIPDEYIGTKMYNYDGLMLNGQHISMVNNTKAAQCATLIALDQELCATGDAYDPGPNPCYKYIHDNVIPGDTIYSSCDRTVCTAVRWAGFDDNFPAGATLQQEEYLVASPRWVEIDWGGNVDMLLPGDVFMRTDTLKSGSGCHEEGGWTAGSGTTAFSRTGSENHHIVIFVGNPIADGMYHCHMGLEAHPDEDLPASINIVHGSFNEYAPRYGSVYEKLRSYHVFRCMQPMEPGKSKYSGYQYTF